MKFRHAVCATLAVASLLNSGATDAEAGASKLWSAKLPDKLVWQRVTEQGTLLVGTKGSVINYDPATGKQLWIRPDIKNIAPFNVREIQGTPAILMVQQTGTIPPKSKGYTVDIATGKTIWETKEIMGSYLGAYAIPERQMAVFFVQQFDGEGGAGTFVRGVNAYTGEQLWSTKYGETQDIQLHIAENSGMFFVKMDLSGHQSPMLVGDTLLLPFQGVHAFDIKTGALKWGVPFKPSNKAFKQSYPPMAVADGSVYASGNGVVYSIDLATGAVRWKTDKLRSGFFGTGVISELTPAGDILFARMGGNFTADNKHWELKEPLGVMAVDRKTGAKLWDDDDLEKGITNLVVLPDNKTVVVADADHLKGYDARGGKKTTEAFEVPLDFKRGVGVAEGTAMGMKIGMGLLTGGLIGAAQGTASSVTGDDRKDVPVQVSLTEHGKVVVRGQQHILSFDPAKKAVDWSSYYEAPGVNDFAIIAMGAFSAAMSMANWGSAMQSGAYAHEASEKAVGGFDEFQKMASKRYTAAKASAERVFFLTEVTEGGDKGPGLVAVDMKTGQTNGQVYLDDKDPKYSVDEVTGRLFFFKNDKEVTGFQM